MNENAVENTMNVPAGGSAAPDKVSSDASEMNDKSTITEPSAATESREDRARRDLRGGDTSSVTEETVTPSPEEGMLKGAPNEEKAEIERLNRRVAELNVARRNDSALADYRRWMKEAEAVKAEYPDFDIEAEAKDARFVSLLKSGIDVRSAYTALHSDVIIAASVEKARAEIAADILRRSARPRENGMSDQSAAVGKPDISSLSRSEVEAIERRVARGEKIYLK